MPSLENGNTERFHLDGAAYVDNGDGWGCCEKEGYAIHFVSLCVYVATRVSLLIGL